MSDPSTPTRRVALVIGNGAYDVATKLTAPRGDAPAMTTLLEGIGFDVIAALDCDYHTFKDRLSDFADRLIEASIGVFYFSGHAVARAGYGNHLLPTDADIREPEDLGRVTIPLDDVMKRMQAPGRASLIFLDACHDDPFAGQSDGVASKGVLIGQNGLRSVQHGDLSEVLIAYAADEGRTAEDGARGRHSPFTEALIAYLPTPGLEIRRVMQEVRRAVIDATEGKQQPWCKDKLSEDLVLVGADDYAGRKLKVPRRVLQDGFWKRWRNRFIALGVIILLGTSWLYAAKLQNWAAALGCSAFGTACGDSATDETSDQQATDISLGSVSGGDGLSVVCGLAAPDCDAFLQRGLSGDAVALAQRIGKMNSSDATTRKAAYSALQSAINGMALGASDRAGLLKAVLSGIAPAKYQALTTNGGFNTLSLLAAVPPDVWFNQLPLSCLETAHQAIAALDAAIQSGQVALGTDTGTFFMQFKANVGYAPRSETVVYFQYVGFPATVAQAIANTLQTNWNWVGIEPALVDRSDLGAEGAIVNEVRYNPADRAMQTAAILMAAELNAEVTRRLGTSDTTRRLPYFGSSGWGHVIPVAEESILMGHVELWLSK